MLFDNITLVEGANIANLSVNTGTLTDKGNLTPNNGEIFYQTDNTAGLYSYDSGSWSRLLTDATAINGGTF